MRGLKGLIVTIAAAMAIGSWSAAASVSEEEAYAVGVDAYLYLYPLVLMEKTRLVLTNIRPGSLLQPMNAFFNSASVQPPSAGAKFYARLNFDALYSQAYIDVSKEPMILSVPDTQGRFYVMSISDMWSDIFAVVGKRTTGTGAGQFALVRPGWHGALPEGIERIDAPTPTIWILCRTYAAGPEDYPAVHAIQAGYRLTPLSQWGGETRPPPKVFDESIDMKTPPPQQVANMAAPKFFALGMALLKREGAHVADQPILARMRKIGLDHGAEFDFSALDPTIQRALERGAVDALKLTLEYSARTGREANGWRIDTDTIGSYGTSYLKRALTARVILGANLPEDSVYAAASVDSDGKPLDGTNRYVIRFEKGDKPPARVFWSVTLYDGDGYAVANPLDRFALGDRSGLTSNADGSLEIVVSTADPGPDKRSNWLPAPAGLFNLTMRLYGPERSVLVGSWMPPPIRRLPRDEAKSSTAAHH